jgi:hypothetical protein
VAEVKADFSSIDMLIERIVSSEKKMKHTVAKISDPSICNGIMITAYVERIRQISRLLGDYKKLLEKDAMDFDKSKNTIANMDAQLKNLYNSNS